MANSDNTSFKIRFNITFLVINFDNNNIIIYYLVFILPEIIVSH